MKHRRTLFFLLLLSMLPGVLHAQQWIAPKPLMTKPVLKAFTGMHLEYPLDARQNKEEGTVLIGFSISEKGEAQERHIVRSVSPAVDSSALRLFDLILWAPAKKYGKAVACPASENKNFAVSFNVRKFNKLVSRRGYDRLPRPYSPLGATYSVYSPKQVDSMPRFIPDSVFKTLNEFIYKQLNYPEEARKLNISGVVRLHFVIEKSGLPSNITVSETVGGGCTEEAISVTQRIRWRPGIKNGKAVRTSFKLSIRFDNPEQLRDKNIFNQQNSGI